ncbi:hypothetical protein HYFRA_00006957 [Hymenoscyphus fraxineus]|uniref:Uncharacterized protein n=1 Tax=Hymenoscyphus fraxineus TaxID=746836 RepID=A0A9N9KNZ0_9HELO|nr:hypothetical protein HYFRA_00006957 [Hymenoscyphus fraxineus]
MQFFTLLLTSALASVALAQGCPLSSYVDAKKACDAKGMDMRNLLYKNTSAANTNSEHVHTASVRIFLPGT